MKRTICAQSSPLKLTPLSQQYNHIQPQQPSYTHQQLASYIRYRLQSFCQYPTNTFILKHLPHSKTQNVLLERNCLLSLRRHCSTRKAPVRAHQSQRAWSRRRDMQELRDAIRMQALEDDPSDSTSSHIPPRLRQRRQPTPCRHRHPSEMDTRHQGTIFGIHDRPFYEWWRVEKQCAVQMV